MYACYRQKRAFFAKTKLFLPEQIRTLHEQHTNKLLPLFFPWRTSSNSPYTLLNIYFLKEHIFKAFLLLPLKNKFFPKNGKALLL